MIQKHKENKRNRHNNDKTRYSSWCVHVRFSCFVLSSVGTEFQAPAARQQKADFPKEQVSYAIVKTDRHKLPGAKCSLLHCENILFSNVCHGMLSSNIACGLLVQEHRDKLKFSGWRCDSDKITSTGMWKSSLLSTMMWLKVQTEPAKTFTLKPIPAFLLQNVEIQKTTKCG